MTAWVDVQPSDIESRWRPLTTAEQAIASQLIADASDELEDALLDIGIEGAPVPTDERWVRRYKRTVVAIVRRVLSNPEGYLSEEIDGYIYRRDKAVSTGTLYVSDSEIDRFRRRRRGSFTITPS
jgi:hypothetical protein